MTSKRKPLPPLRKVEYRFPGTDGNEYEHLECGHEVHRKQDMFGPTNAYRRRCRKCLSK